MKVASLFVGIACVIALTTATARAADPKSVDFSADKIRVTKLRPNSSIAFLFVGRTASDLDMTTMIHKSGVVIDDDGDGVVEILFSGRTIPPSSVIAVVDLSDLSYVIESPPGRSVTRRQSNLRFSSSNGKLRSVIQESRDVDFLVSRATGRSWANNRGEVQHGIRTSEGFSNSADEFSALIGQSALEEFAIGDLVTAIDYTTLEVTVTEVTQ